MYSEIAKNKRKTVLIMFFFFVFVAALALLLSYIYQDYSITVLVIVFSIGYGLWGYFGSSRVALAMNGAKEIQKRDDVRLWRVVENLCITTGLPMPKVYIIEDRALNAFATGRDPKHASVAVTRGLLDTLNDSELEGVMAHELGHVQNYDIRVAMIAFALASVIGLICDFFLRMSFWGSFTGDGDGDGDSGSNNGILMILGIIALILAPIVALMVQMAISRKREYLADATGAMTTRYPEALADALEKIKQNGATLRRQNSSTAHFFIANPIKGRSISSLFSTHPPIDERIRILRTMDTKV